MRRASPLIPVCALVGTLLLTTGGAAAAAPVTPPVTPLFTIAADNAAAVPAGHNWAFNDFFPRSATIAQGGTFQFTNGGGFHTATLLPLSWTAPVRTADMDVNGIASADLDDTSANPNGTTHVLENIAPLLPVQPTQGCGTADAPCVFDGTAIVSMGAPLNPGPPAPFFITVTAPVGTYVFHCRIHPMMSGSLTVVAGAPAAAPDTTTSTSADAAAAAQATVDVAAGLAAEAAASTAAVKTNPNGSHTWTLAVGTSDPTGHVSILEMLPRKVTIRPGDAVVWRPLAVNEPHTVTFPGELHTDTLPLCEGAGGRDTLAVPTVNPPTGPQDFACNGQPANEIEFGGGNGAKVVTSPKTVADSGLVARASEALAFDVSVTGVRQSWAVRFANAKPGTYHYICQIHAGMVGTIVVH